MPNKGRLTPETYADIAERICIETIESAKVWVLEHKRYPAIDELAELLRPIREREETGLDAAMKVALGGAFVKVFPTVLRRLANEIATERRHNAE